MHRLRAAAALTTAALTGIALAPTANAAGRPDTRREPVEVVAEGLSDPFGLRWANNRFYVAETGSGEVSRLLRPGGPPSVRASGLNGPTGVDWSRGKLLVVTGESHDPEASGGSTLFTSRSGGPLTPVADLMAYELEHNPDGQRQFGDDGAPLDALSNPVAVLAGKGEVLAYIADGGANAVLAVDREGTVSTFFVPPVVTSGECEGRPNNDPEHTGCDSVPTGLAYGPGGTLYVSTLSGEAAGEGRVYVLDARSGAVEDVISGLDGPTGVAVGDRGEVYVSEILENAPEGEPGPDFDPAAVGRIVRIDCDGSRSYAQVTMPLGLEFAHGALYSTSWSVGSFLGMPDTGQIVRVDSSAFTAEG